MPGNWPIADWRSGYALYLSSTFELTGISTDRGWDYSRAGNPTH